MAVSTDQLTADYKEVQERFAHSPYVSILSTEGEPPKSYEIEYRIKGLTKNDAGELVPADCHRVEIVLPFGYPHFPPSCRPLTSVFHPDFDPDAIRIVDFWEKSRSLSDLIVHIGNLICFAQHSSENVFNTEAFEWANMNSDKLPLEKIDFSVQVKESEPVSDDDEDMELSMETENEKEAETSQLQGERPKPEATITPRQASIPQSSSNLFKLLGITTLLVLVTAAGLLVLDIRNHSKTEQNWQDIQALVKENQFTEANRLILESQKRLGSIKFLKKAEKQVLLQNVNRLANSEKFQQGVQGKMLVNGVYLTARELQAVKELSDHLSQGEKLAETSQWGEASKAFEKAVTIAKDMGENSPMSVPDVQELFTRSLILAQIATGNSLRAHGKWKQALGIYEDALEQLETIKNMRQDTPTSKRDISTSILNKTEEFLEQARLGAGALGSTQNDIRKKILSASIEREEYRVASYLQQEEYGRAVKSLQSIVSLINKSPFAAEKKFAAIKQSALTRLEENTFLFEIQEKIKYLYAHYQQIFKEKFDSAATSELSDPEIEFVKSSGKILIFKMQCQEKIRRQKYTLEMFSQYDTVSQSWSVYK
ncbi:MAG: hypothetical protein H8E41_13235 [Desulfobulbaceae bacterium]|uniref:UBC core domain-containing protein n=1 Tax=Candidatus Desulfobia pelagia TaxID=2841692 RepID=A0A8J6TH66_9BACT|nr:hypothetical protein [Candidatus Desulfobia pelagia]